MDPFEHLVETPDLNGQVRLLSYRPIFTNPYSCIYRGRFRHNHEFVSYWGHYMQRISKVLSGRNQGPQCRRGRRTPYHAKGGLYFVQWFVANNSTQKLRRERRAWGALSHPNILPLYGFADDEEMFQPFGALVSPVGLFPFVRLSLK
jgi:hypothetical protein